jgi:dUTP pyrophosphatase
MYYVQFALSEGAVAPTRGTEGSVGWDLYSPMKQVIPPKSVRKICTGVRIGMPPGLYCRLYGRSSLFVRGLIFNTGVIDTDYRGEVCGLAYNTLDDHFFFEKGDRIGQLVFASSVELDWLKVEKLENTERGENGFGSTGV